VDKTSLKKATGLTPAKLILIGVLSLVLLAVLYIQFGSSSAETASPPYEPPHCRPAVAATQPAAPKPVDDNKQTATTADAVPKKAEITSNWQTADVATAVQYDPFALPPLFPQRIQEAKDNKLAKDAVETDDGHADAAARAESLKELTTEFSQLQRQGVRVIMQKQDKYVAMIGDKTIHVGDDIDGFTVVAIDANGVRVARDLKQ
jgi:hypothetical protein